MTRRKISLIGNRNHESEAKVCSMDPKKSEKGVKAAKNDDAKVDEYEWDIWSVNSFELELENSTDVVCPAKVCVSKRCVVDPEFWASNC